MTRQICAGLSYQIWNLRRGPVANCIFIFFTPLLSPDVAQHSEKTPRASSEKRNHFIAIRSGVCFLARWVRWRRERQVNLYMPLLVGSCSSSSSYLPHQAQQTLLYTATYCTGSSTDLQYTECIAWLLVFILLYISITHIIILTNWWYVVGLVSFFSFFFSKAKNPWNSLIN